jgi:hypothetical protein
MTTVREERKLVAFQKRNNDDGREILRKGDTVGHSKINGRNGKIKEKRR